MGFLGGMWPACGEGAREPMSCRWPAEPCGLAGLGRLCGGQEQVPGTGLPRGRGPVLSAQLRSRERVTRSL